MIPLLVLLVTTVLAATVAETEPQTYIEEHVVEARFVQKGIKRDPKKLPDRIVPRKSTAPDKSIVVSKDMNPEPPRQAQGEGPPENAAEDLLTRLGDRAQAFAEIAEEREKEGDPERHRGGHRDRSPGRRPLRRPALRLLQARLDDPQHHQRPERAGDRPPRSRSRPTSRSAISRREVERRRRCSISRSRIACTSCRPRARKCPSRRPRSRTASSASRSRCASRASNRCGERSQLAACTRFRSKSAPNRPHPTTSEETMSAPHIRSSIGYAIAAAALCALVGALTWPNRGASQAAGTQDQPLPTRRRDRRRHPGAGRSTASRCRTCSATARPRHAGGEVLRNDLRLVSLFKVLDPRSFIANLQQEGLGITKAPWSERRARRAWSRARSPAAAAASRSTCASSRSRAARRRSLKKTYRGSDGRAARLHARLRQRDAASAHRQAGRLRHAHHLRAQGRSGPQGRLRRRLRRPQPGPRQQRAWRSRCCRSFGPGGVWYSVLTPTGMFITNVAQARDADHHAAAASTCGPAICGGRVLFSSTRDGNSEIYSANPDGSDVRRLDQPPGDRRQPGVRPGRPDRVRVGAPRRAADLHDEQQRRRAQARDLQGQPQPDARLVPRSRTSRCSPSRAATPAASTSSRSTSRPASTGA